MGRLQGNHKKNYLKLVFFILKFWNVKTSCVFCYLTGCGRVFSPKLYSTDLALSAEQIVKCYRARFQIELLSRDAKQPTGLEHSQARDSRRLYFHFNTSLTSVSIGKALLKIGSPRDRSISLSIADIKTEIRNRNMIHRIFSMYGLSPYLIKNNPGYRELLDFG